MKGKSGPARLAEDNENTNTHYVVYLGGERVPGSRISAIRSTIRACLNDFARHTTPPETWSQATITLQDFIHGVVSARFSELTICEGNWKLDQMIQRIYWDWMTGWKKNNGHHASVSKKRKAKNLPTNDLATKKPRSSSPSMSLSANAKGKQKAQSRSQSPASSSSSRILPVSTLGSSSSGPDYSSLSSGSGPLSSASGNSSSTTSDSSLATSNFSLVTPSSLIASPDPASAVSPAGTSGPSAISSGPSPRSAGATPLAVTSDPSIATSGLLAGTSAIPLPSPTFCLSTLDPNLSPTVDALLALSGNPPIIIGGSSVSTGTAPGLTKLSTVKNPL